MHARHAAAPAHRKAPIGKQQWQAHLRAGQAHLQRKDWRAAARELGAATASPHASAADWMALAYAHTMLVQQDRALAAAQHAVALEPASVEAHKLLARCFIHLNRHAEAVAVYRAMPGGVPAHHDTLLNYGSALTHMGQPEAAIAPIMQALAMQVDSVPAYMRLGSALKEAKLYEEAVEAYRTVVALEPENLAALSYVVHLSQQACQWHSFDADVRAMLGVLERLHAAGGQPPESTPFAMVPIPHHPRQMRMAGELQVRNLLAGVQPLPAVPAAARRQRGNAERLRIGYLSCDFSQHATALLLTEVFERHDRTRIELFLYDHSRDDSSLLRRRLKAAADHFVDVRPLSPRAIAERMRADGIDIAIDLKGYTQANRLQTFAFRPAPVQATWLGFPGTTGAGFFDYFIGDPWVTPLDHAPWFSEKLAQMPVCYQPNDRQRARPDGRARRSDWGLPEGRPVLASFNGLYKITAETWDCWLRILHAAPDAVLWLLASNPQAQAALLREAAARGIEAARIVFAQQLPFEQHQARLPLADLIIDTWPCNAHTTASDALWAGLPIVTLTAETFASRVAGSLLRAMDAPELVCTDVAGYEQTVLALLADRPRLAALRRRIEAARDTAPLFDSARFAADLEALYARMWARHQAGRKPEHLPAEAATTG